VCVCVVIYMSSGDVITIIYFCMHINNSLKINDAKCEKLEFNCRELLQVAWKYKNGSI
jgi:hypothetical protein